jgi:hypothetical protein
MYVIATASGCRAPRGEACRRAAVGERAAGLHVGHDDDASGFRIFAVSAMKCTPANR